MNIETWYEVAAKYKANDYIKMVHETSGSYQSYEDAVFRLNEHKLNPDLISVSIKLVQHITLLEYESAKSDSS